MCIGNQSSACAFGFSIDVTASCRLGFHVHAAFPKPACELAMLSIKELRVAPVTSRELAVSEHLFVWT
jgi:hypothetical protein